MLQKLGCVLDAKTRNSLADYGYLEQAAKF